MLSKARLALLFVLALTSTFEAQMPGTGVYSLGSFASKGFDTINLGNNNIHFEIPIINKPGRGLPFVYSLVYDGLIWSPIASSGTEYWHPVQNWGFEGLLNQTGVVGQLQTTVTPWVNCAYVQTGPKTFTKETGTTTLYFYLDPFGRLHRFAYTVKQCPYDLDGNPDPPPTIIGTGGTVDGSGYSFDGQNVHNLRGTIISAPVNPQRGVSASGQMTDLNGNIISSNGSGVYTDTLGVTELTISGGGNASSPLQLTYPVTEQANNATTATATIYYKTYTVQTNFQATGISEYGPASQDLVDHVTLADGSTYGFTYEGTPAHSGNVTGRLASITLPTGGAISYAYHYGSTGGINTDGTPAGITRTTADGTSEFDRNSSQFPVTTEYTHDEEGNETDLSFIASSANGNTYETSRSVYQGAQSGGTLLESRTTTYNGQSSSTELTGTITQTSVADTYNGGATATTATNYDPTGTLVTSTSVSSGSTTLVSTTTSYNNYGEITSTATMDGSGNTISSASFGFDETAATGTSGIPQHSVITSTPGNQTSAHISTGSSTLSSTTAYYDTGMPVSSTAPGGYTTSYAYDSTQTFATQTTLPTPSSGVGLSTSAAYDANSGVQISSTGLNSGQTFTYAQYDPLLRPTQVTTPEDGQVTYAYTPNQISTITKISSSQSADQEAFLDAYGRTRRAALSNGTYWYLTDLCYDPDGRLQYQSTAYVSSSENPSSYACSSSSGTQYTYDALGRKTAAARADGSSVSIVYGGRAVQTTTSNGVSRITQYDALGRITSVCEISSNSSMPSSGAPGNCGMDIAGTGFLTSYSYNLATHTATVTQGGQTRTFITDAAGRTSSTTEPEAGTATYAYIYTSTGLQVTRTRPQANQTNASVTTTTTTQYDSLGRPVSVSYTDGTPAKTFQYDQASSGSLSLGYSKGQLTTMKTTSGGTTISQRISAYDIMGRVSEKVECLPNLCGQSNHDVYRWFTYNLASLLTNDQYATVGGGGSPAYFSYTYNSAGQVTYVGGNLGSGNNGTNSYSSNPYTMTPFGPALTVMGNDLFTTYSYDALGRANVASTCAGSQQAGCPGGSTVYAYSATIVGNQVKQSSDTVLGQTRNYNYDEFGRLSSLSTVSGSGSAIGMSLEYDRYGNRWQQNMTAGSGPQPQYSFNTANNQLSGYQYDAVGNVINDGLHTYSYDAENQLTGLDGGSTASYAYDATNQRVFGAWGGQTQDYGLDLYGRRSTTWENYGPVAHVQYYMGNQRYGFWDAADGNFHFEHQDWLGTERVRTTANGTVEGTYGNFPFGDYASSSGIDLSMSHFAQLDADINQTSQLDHAAFREYAAWQGRWMSPDPYSGSYHWQHPQSLNRYAYTMSSPLSATDPNGLQCVYSDTGVPADDGTGGGCAAAGIASDGTETDPYEIYVGGGFGFLGTSGGTATGAISWNLPAPSSLLGKICGAVPSGTVVSVSGNGNFVGTAGSLDLVTNGRTGEVTGFFSPGYFAGAATAGGALTGGYTFGNLGAGNSNFAGGFSGISGGYGIYAGSVATSSGGPASPLSGISPTSSGHVTTVAFGVQTPGRALSASSTFSLPTQLGSFWTLADPATALVYLANQACKAAGH